MSFAETVKDELNYQGMFVKELAARANVNINTLNHYLVGNKSMPSADTAVKIAKVLGVTVEYLITGETASEKEIPNYKRYKNLLTELDKLTADEYETAEPFLFGTIKTQLEQRTRKVSKTG